MYNPIYAFINQFHFSKTRHPAIPFADNDVKPNINITIYMPTKKKRHWKIKLQNPLTLDLIPNHPEINTKNNEAFPQHHTAISGNGGAHHHGFGMHGV